MPANTLKLIRQTHLYIGIFISPALLFFALSGALQTFRLHEITPGSSYRPPAWVLTLAAIHKHQMAVGPPPKAVSGPGSAAAGKSARRADASPAPGRKPAADPSLAAPAAAASHLPMQIFFLLVAIGLFTSTLSGVYMAYRYNRSKPLVTGLLLAGIALPLLLLRFQ